MLGLTRLRESLLKALLHSDWTAKVRVLIEK
jgi:hypothetical protein